MSLENGTVYHIDLIHLVQNDSLSNQFQVIALQ